MLNGHRHPQPDDALSAIDPFAPPNVDDTAAVTSSSGKVVCCRTVASSTVTNLEDARFVASASSALPQQLGAQERPAGIDRDALTPPRFSCVDVDHDVRANPEETPLCGHALRVEQWQVRFLGRQASRWSWKLHKMVSQHAHDTLCINRPAARICIVHTCTTTEWQLSGSACADCWSCQTVFEDTCDPECSRKRGNCLLEFLHALFEAKCRG